MPTSHKQAFARAVESAEALRQRAAEADSCLDQFRLHRDAWHSAGEAFVHLLGMGEGRSAPHAGGVSGTYNNLLRQLDKLSATVEKRCIKRPRRPKRV
jgi:hypothetical protein